MRIGTSGTNYVVQTGVVPDVRGRWLAPPMAKINCTKFRDIKSVPTPAACTYRPRSLNVATNAASSLTLASASPTVLSIFSGVTGNVGFPDTPGGSVGRVHVTNQTPSGSEIRQQRNTMSVHFNFTADALVFSCRGATFKLPVNDLAITATTSIVTQQLVAAADAAHTRCFINGLGGPWGWLPQHQKQPRARIFTDEAGNIKVSVTPTGLPAATSTDLVAGSRDMHRFEFTTIVFLVAHTMGCSSETRTPPADAGGDGAADAAASDGGLDAAARTDGGCRPTGAPCADNLMACCSSGCFASAEGSSCE